MVRKIVFVGKSPPKRKMDPEPLESNKCLDADHPKLCKDEDGHTFSEKDIRSAIEWLINEYDMKISLTFKQYRKMDALIKKAFVAISID